MLISLFCDLWIAGSHLQGPCSFLLELGCVFPALPSQVSTRMCLPPLCSQCVLVLALPSTLHRLFLSRLSEFLFDSECCFPDFSGCWRWAPPVPTHLQTLTLHATCARLDSAGASGATGDHPVKAKLLVVFSHEALLMFIR